MLLIGSHVSFKSNTLLLGSTKEALSYGENTFMFYTGAPQNTKRSKIDDNLTNKDFTPRYIADRLAISPRSLYRKMEEIGEDSPTDLIKECRLLIAKDLLLTTKKTIDEIVFDSGFSNKVTFFKVFREKYECTPKEFRQKHLAEVQ